MELPVTSGVPVYEVDPAGGVVLTVFVQPGAARAGVVGCHGDALKLKVAAAPERGKANAAVVALLAAELGVRPSDVEVLSGHGSRRKRVHVAGVDGEHVAAWLSSGD